MSPTTPAVARLIAQAAEAATPTAECDAQEAALNECVTLADWEACLEAFGERAVGAYIADNADEFASNDGWGEGCAYIQLGDAERDEAAYVSWTSDGFYSVEFGSAREARGAVDKAAEEWSAEEGDEENDEENDVA